MGASWGTQEEGTGFPRGPRGLTDEEAGQKTITNVVFKAEFHRNSGLVCLFIHRALGTLWHDQEAWTELKDQRLVRSLRALASRELGAFEQAHASQVPCRRSFERGFQWVQLECHYGIKAATTIYGMVFGT